LNITQLQADYKNVVAQWQRQKVLYSRKLVDPQTFDKSRLELTSADLKLQAGRQQLIQSKAQLAQAENNLAKPRIYSPLDGVVTTLAIKEAETAIARTMNLAGSSLMTIANPASLQAEVYVDEADISHVVPGQRATVIAIAQNNQPISGRVDFLAEPAAIAPARHGLRFSIIIRLDAKHRLN